MKLVPAASSRVKALSQLLVSLLLGAFALGVLSYTLRHITGTSSPFHVMLPLVNARPGLADVGNHELRVGTAVYASLH